MENSLIKSSFKVLDKVYRQKAYVNIALNDEIKNQTKENKAIITSIVYGVLDNDIYLDYCLDKLVKKVKPVMRVMLKLGLYEILFSKLPKYASVNAVVELSKENKKELASFVNAVLRKATEIDFPLPEDPIENLSIRTSYPEYLVKELIKTYGYETTEKILTARHPKNHVRVVDRDRFIKNAETNALIYTPSQAKDGVYISYNDLEEIDDRAYTIQGLSSVLCVESIGIKNKDRILDVCAAPGGKSVYMAQLAQNGIVVACDIHKHRLELIKSYANKYGVKNIEVINNDGTKLNESFINCFDIVLCDVPCSGFGVANSKPDIKINREKDTSLPSIQYSILENSSRYVKKGGTLFYSTCTILDSENTNIVVKFIKSHPDFKEEEIVLPLKGISKPAGVQLLQGINSPEGFYMAKLIRKWFY